MKVLTANRLDDGEVVFWAAGAWVDRFVGAEVFADSDRVEVAEGHAKAAFTAVVDPYVIDVAPISATEEDAASPVAPISYRERLRALGPTNKREHGKQAAGGADVDRLNSARGAARSSGRVNLIKRK